MDYPLIPGDYSVFKLWMHNEDANKKPEHPKATYREPDELIIICATAPMAYTTENGVRVIPIGCLRD